VFSNKAVKTIVGYGSFWGCYFLANKMGSDVAGPEGIKAVSVGLACGAAGMFLLMFFTKDWGRNV